MNIINNIIGFTIVELMITLALAAVLLTIGIPSFTQLLRKNAITSQSNTILSSLLYARSEAITENNNSTNSRLVLIGLKVGKFTITQPHLLLLYALSIQLITPHLP